MKSHFAAPPLLAGLLLLACTESRTPTEPIASKPSLNVTGTTTPCVGTLPPGAYDNVEVPPGATCFLDNATIRGSVKALETAQLYMYNSQVAGNVDGDKAAVVQVGDSRVGGSIQIKEGFSPQVEEGVVVNGTVLEQGNIQVEKMRTGTIYIVNVQLDKGNIKVEENSTSIYLNVISNFTPRNIQVFKNTGTSSKSVTANIAGEAVQCFENDPIFIGGPNTAPVRQGQCF